MFQYTTAIKKAYPWAKAAYDFALGNSNVSTITLSDTLLSSPIAPSIDTLAITIKSSNDWNSNSKRIVAYLGGIFASIDYAYDDYNSIYSLINARLQEAEANLRALESQFTLYEASSNLTATTSIPIAGGDSTSIDPNPLFYGDYPPLLANEKEGVFRLQDTGWFSAIRAPGGFPGYITVENSLGKIFTTGNLQNVVDGSNLGWIADYYCPAPIRAAPGTVAWLPQDYQQGFALQLTCNLNVPIQATEIYLEPLSTEPFQVASIEWDGANQINLINDTDFPGSEWSYTPYANSMNGAGLANSKAILTTSPSGFASWTFSIPASTMTLAGTGFYYLGNRVKLSYSMKGQGYCYAGAKILWLDSGGNVINYSQKTDFPAGFYNTYSLVSNIPVNCASGTVEFGVFSYTTGPASALFDNANLTLGDETFEPMLTITGPTTISLPKIINTSRITVTLAQINPRIETLTKDVTDPGFSPISGNPNINPQIQELTQTLYNQLSYPGPEVNTFVYRLGLKELDIRYREHIPRGAIVSYPLNSNQEVRQIWVTTENGLNYSSGISFSVFPFATDPTTQVPIQPYTITKAGGGTASNGEILYIYTDEEQTDGWVNTTQDSYIVSPIQQIDRFDGTDITGKISLTTAPHLRRPTLKSELAWLNTYGIFPTQFDPNASIIYGLDPTLYSQQADAIRAGDIGNLSLNTTQFVSTTGYQPIAVTVSTEAWTAVPDTLGNPSVSKVRTIFGEILQLSSLTQTTVTSNKSYITFSSWLTNQTVSYLVTNLSTIANIIPSTLQSQLKTQFPSTATLQQVIDVVGGNTKSQLQIAYNALLAQGQVPVNQSTATTQTSTIAVNDVFSTKFAPIISGPNGVDINLFGISTTTIGPTTTYIPLSRSDYTVLDANTGTIQIITPPPGGYVAIVANYLYLNTANTDDYFGSALSYFSTNNASTGSYTSISDAGNLKPRTFPVTRNMTDYVNGTIPSLKLPNFNTLDSDYYPVVEYYQDSIGELIFARDFSKHGDTFANIQVVYETLNINPRLNLQVIREASAATTPTIYNMTLRVKENSGSLVSSL